MPKISKKKIQKQKRAAVARQGKYGLFLEKTPEGVVTKIKNHSSAELLKNFLSMLELYFLSHQVPENTCAHYTVGSS